GGSMRRRDRTSGSNAMRASQWIGALERRFLDGAACRLLRAREFVGIELVQAVRGHGIDLGSHAVELARARLEHFDQRCASGPFPSLRAVLHGLGVFTKCRLVTALHLQAVLDEAPAGATRSFGRKRGHPGTN